MVFEKCKNYLFRSILVGVIFSQVSPSIPQQVVYLVMCTLTLSELQVSCDTLALTRKLDHIIFPPINLCYCLKICRIGLLHDPVTRYGLVLLGCELHSGTSRKGIRTSSARLSFVYKVPLCNLRLSIIYEYGNVYVIGHSLLGLFRTNVNK